MTEQALVVKTGPRDVFLHLLAIIALYSVVVGFWAIAFSLIDIYLPDALSEPAIYLRDNLRFPLAAVGSIFPLYILLSYFLSRDVERNPEIRNFGRSRNGCPSHSMSFVMTYVAMSLPWTLRLALPTNIMQPVNCHLNFVQHL